MEGNGKKTRLSEHVRPIRYKLTLEPDLDNFIFSGTEEIGIHITKATRSVTLHAAELEILSVSCIQGKKKLEGAVNYNKKEERATLVFKEMLRPGKWLLKFTFTGILNDKMRGFYRSRYDRGGKTYHMAVTQFESTDARRAFPCFDEPAHKAIFEVSLIVPKDRVAISNTLESDISEYRSEYNIVTFAPSPKMSSYLLAFIVGHFDHLEGKTRTGTLVRVFTTPGKKHQAVFALACAIKTIEFYEKYFGIRYPLPAMDLIAIPDFAAGAMENWGAVTYRETAILVDPEHTALQNRQRVALVIAHELAHQWFGNLVTMEWWTHLWLNEGFATYMEYVAIDSLFPEWNIWEQFVLTEHSRALALDGLTNTHAIEIEVHHPEEISEIFDAISYSKGASVIRMLARYLGEKSFRKGLQGYLKKHSYGNAETSDLWQALERSSGKPVKKIMDSWTKKPGYPLVKVEQKDGAFRFTQERFLSDGKKKKGVWPLPLSTLRGKKVDHVFLNREKTSSPDYGANFIKVNLGETSFIRAKYSRDNLRALGKEVKKKNSILTGSDRFGILRDAFALAQSGMIPTAEVLELTEAYKGERSYSVWVLLAEQMLILRALFFGKPQFEDFCSYGRSLFAPAALESGWVKKKGESNDQTLLRSTLLYTSGVFGDRDTIKKARELFSRERRGKGNIPADVRATVYSLVALNGGPKEYRTLWSMYQKSTLEEEKDRLLRALSSFKNTALSKKTLHRAFSKNSRGQDTVKAVTFTFINPYGRKAAWNYLTSHWSPIVKRFAGGHLFSRFAGSASSFTTKEDAQRVEQFFKQHPTEGIGRTVAQSIEQIHSRAAWYTRDRKNIQKFLSSR